MRMMKAIPLVFLVACAAPSADLSRPAAVALSALPSAQFGATMQVALEVAQTCSDYEFDANMQNAVIAQRRASGVAGASFGGRDLETDVTRRSFQAKHVITVGQQNSCAAIQSEIAENSAISALFVAR